VTRLDRVDRDATPVGTLSVSVGADEAELVLRAPVAQALVEALYAYRDPRDHGQCGSCGGALDRNFRCLDCGALNGLFGQMVLERAEGFTEEPG
jgi:hypothetical protein